MLRLGTLCGHPSDVMCEYPEVVSQKVICIPETRVRTNLGACILTLYFTASHPLMGGLEIRNPRKIMICVRLPR